MTTTPDEICERLRAVESAAPEWHDGPTTCWHRNPDGPEAADLIQQQQADIERLSAALVAMADAADKCSEAPHFIVQPFLGIYRKHGETIAEARAALGKDASDV